jgi:hypothetical protein
MILFVRRIIPSLYSQIFGALRKIGRFYTFLLFLYETLNLQVKILKI